MKWEKWQKKLRNEFRVERRFYARRAGDGFKRNRRSRMWSKAARKVYHTK